MSSYYQTITQKHQELIELKTKLALLCQRAIKTDNFIEVVELKTKIAIKLSYINKIVKPPCRVFKCFPEQIAHNKQEINEITKAYVGPLFPNIFKKLSHLENQFISFPEGKIKKETIIIGGKTKTKLMAEMKEVKIQISEFANQVMNNKNFTTTEESELVQFVRLKVGDLFPNSQPTTDELYTKAKEFGLELCQSQDGPNYRLYYLDQPYGEWTYVGMKQISDFDGDLRIFKLNHADDGFWLRATSTYAGRLWNSDVGFIFRVSTDTPTQNV